LKAGKVKVADFDFRFLRFNAGRHGQQAFERLKRDGRADIRDGASVVALLEDRYDQPVKPAASPLPKIQVYPAGQALPADFKAQFAADPSPSFCSDIDKPCRANIHDLDKDGVPEILIEAGEGVAVYKRGDAGWTRYGFFRLTECYPASADPQGDMTRFITGQLETVAPEMPDIRFAGERFRITPEQQRCNVSDIGPAKRSGHALVPLAH